MNSEQDNHLSDEQEYQSHPSEDMGQGIHQPVATGADAGETEPHEPEDAHLEIDAPTSTTSLAHAGGGGGHPSRKF